MIAAESSNIELVRVRVEGEPYYKITNVDALRPFFMNVVSDANHWLFISSNGGLSIGRQNAESALFPYYTEDKITESAEQTGSKTILRVMTGEGRQTWEPFSERTSGIFEITRNLYKHVCGHKIVFEEVNRDLGLTFRYAWNTSKKYGFVKKAELVNQSEASQSVSVLDGMQNILPYGVPSDLQLRVSNLVDAYKRSELIADTGLGIYALSAIIVDKAEPSEALKANIAWSQGLDNPVYLLSSMQLDRFRNGKELRGETDIKGEKGAYFVHADLKLEPGEQKDWIIVADINYSQSAVVALTESLRAPSEIRDEVLSDIDRGTRKLFALNAASDGIQLTSDRQRDTRHFANTLFNIMRGGIFDHNYRVERRDVEDYLRKANSKVFTAYAGRIRALPAEFSFKDLTAFARETDDAAFRRLCLEYLPLKFSRRHGDPSRPWNRFSINTHKEDGSKLLDYEGNWRDIFQNWEALGYSYPEFLEGMICKFLNASTFDGYNPYRITKDGFDWETIEPEDPWSYIGYWGDHQVIYLLKFLEALEKHHPGRLAGYFESEIFVYADVPYRIKPYEQLLSNPKDTIEFDDERDGKIRRYRRKLGADGALMHDEDLSIYTVNFIEKIMAVLIAKLSNFIPEGGIWMNTQRPEWNDANNALVGNGVSVVTLCYLRRFLAFFNGILAGSETERFRVSNELIVCYKHMRETLERHVHLLDGKLSDDDRKNILDGLGQPASDYRAHIYSGGFWGEKRTISRSGLMRFIKIALQFAEHSIRSNERKDGLFHAYNLMTPEPEGAITISRLDEMLEGQVAVLSSGCLSARQAVSVLDAMKKSTLFREDQYSYLLYPNKDLPGFMKKNNIPASAVKDSELLTAMLADGDGSIVEQDMHGSYHFNGDFRNAGDLRRSLKKLTGTKYADLARKETNYVLQIFEKVFNHKAFTGRSGTFFGYEGLGSIYWHMVSKLRLAVLECCLAAIEAEESAENIGRLLEHYYEIREGIGVHKPPSLYGAFPTDPYSHTPAGKGAQQPGMTGQVKEDILCRIGELGVFVQNGRLRFHPCMLLATEFLQETAVFEYVDVNGDAGSISVPAGALAFTYCQVPVVYQKSEISRIELTLASGQTLDFKGSELDEKYSSSIFGRTGEVARIDVHIDDSLLK